METRLIDIYETTQILGISRPTLSKYIKQGMIVPTKKSVTGRHLFDEDYIVEIKKQVDAEREDMYSPKEVADKLGICLATVSEYERKGQLIVAKRPTAHRKLYSKESVEKLMNKAQGKFLTTEEIAKELGCSPALIAFLDAEGTIKSVKKSHTNVKYYSREAFETVKKVLEHEEI